MSIADSIDRAIIRDDAPCVETVGCSTVCDTCYICVSAYGGRAFTAYGYVTCVVAVRGFYLRALADTRGSVLTAYVSRVVAVCNGYCESGIAVGCCYNTAGTCAIVTRIVANGSTVRAVVDGQLYGVTFRKGTDNTTGSSFVIGNIAIIVAILYQVVVVIYVSDNTTRIGGGIIGVASWC